MIENLARIARQCSSRGRRGAFLRGRADRRAVQEAYSTVRQTGREPSAGEREGVRLAWETEHSLAGRVHRRPQQEIGERCGPAGPAFRPAPADPALAGVLTTLERRYGEEIDAVVLYGSWLRGNAGAMPDLYVLLRRYPPAPRLDRWLGALLPPNVYVVTDGELRAKVSVLRTQQLLNAVTVDFHPYFWARFLQPCRLVRCRDEEIGARLEYIARQSARRLLDAMGAPGSLTTSAAYWQAVLKRTYAAELRSERAGKFDEIYEANRAWYDALFRARGDGADRPLLWRLRQAAGKTLSAARILKSVFTFEDPVGYMLWKLERHSGVRIQATERQRRYPLLFAWPLVWRLYREGAFR